MSVNISESFFLAFNAKLNVERIEDNINNPISVNGNRIPLKDMPKEVKEIFLVLAKLRTKYDFIDIGYSYNDHWAENKNVYYAAIIDKTKRSQQRLFSVYYDPHELLSFCENGPYFETYDGNETERFPLSYGANECRRILFTLCDNALSHHYARRCKIK